MANNQTLCTNVVATHIPFELVRQGVFSHEAQRLGHSRPRDLKDARRPPFILGVGSASNSREMSVVCLLHPPRWLGTKPPLFLMDHGMTGRPSPSRPPLARLGTDGVTSFLPGDVGGQTLDYGHLEDPSPSALWQYIQVWRALDTPKVLVWRWTTDRKYTSTLCDHTLIQEAVDLFSGDVHVMVGLFSGDVHVMVGLEIAEHGRLQQHVANHRCLLDTIKAESRSGQRRWRWGS